MKKLILTLIFLAISVSAEAATTRYVDACTNALTTYNAATRSCTTGADSVYSTIPNGLAVTAAGDTLDVRAGTYSATLNGSNVPSGSNDNARVMIQCHTGETCNQTGAISLEGPSYVTFSGFTMTGGGGIWVGSTNADGSNVGHHIRFINMEVSGVTADNLVNVNHWGHHVEVIGGSFHNATTVGATCSASGSNACYAFYISGKDNLVEHAKIYSNPSYGIHSYSGYGAGQLPDRNIYRYNELYSNGGNSGTVSASILLGSGDSQQAYGNVVHDNPGDGIASSNGATNSKIFNNTVYNNNTLKTGYGGILWGSGSGTTIKNNISYSNAGGDFVDSGGGAQTPTRSNNHCTSAGTGCVTTGNPLFVDAAGGNFSLTSTSPVIDQGVAAIATGVAACANGSAPDIGAIESLPQPTATVNGSAAVITVANNCASQMLPASSVTGWSFKKNGSGDTVTANSLSGTNSYAATLTSAFIGGDTCLFSYSQTGNSVSNNNVGGSTTNNQEIFAFTDASCTNITGGGGPTLAYTHGRWYLLQGATDTAWVPKGAADANVTIAPGAKLNLRWKVKNTGADTSLNPRIRVSYDGGSYVELTSSYVNAVRALGSGAQLGTVMSDSSPMTQDQLTSDVSNIACNYIRNPVSAPNLTLTTNTETECGAAIDFDTTAVTGKQYDFKVYTDTGTAIGGGPISAIIGSYAGAR